MIFSKTTDSEIYKGVIDMEMTAKEYLLQYRIAINKVKRKQEQIEKLRADLLPSGISYDGMPGAGGNRTAADIFARLEELERELKGQQDNARAKAKEIIAVIEQVEDERYRGILHDRYIMGMHWKDIIEQTGYTNRHIFRVHRFALLEIDRILKNVTKCH